MSEETSPLVTIRLSGRNMIPGEVRSRELAEIIESFEEMLACVIVDRHTNVKKDDVLIGISSLEGGSIRLGFRSAWATMVVAAYLSVAYAVSENKFTSLPENSIKAIDRIIAFTRRHHCVVEFRKPDNDELIASITPDTNTEISGLISGQTTIHGQILRVGGKKPRVTVETTSDSLLYCDVSFEIAQQLGKRLYEFAEFSGTASWNPNNWEIKEFRIESFTPNNTKTPEQTMNELRDLVGKYFDDIDDVESYVSSIRRASEDD